MENIKIAFASDDGENFMGRHFGDSQYYFVYQLADDKLEFNKKISNTTEDEEGHSDAVKAGNIGSLLKKEGVNITVSKIYGPNIKRIRKKFVCIVSKSNRIEVAKQGILDNIELIKKEWERGESRTHLEIWNGDKTSGWTD